ATYSARLRKLTYTSAAADGKPVTLSALMVLPETPDGQPVPYAGRPVVIAQRASVDPGEPAPSTGGDVTLLHALLAAGKGHVALVPDLIGVGSSAQQPQAWLLARETALQTQDLLMAARDYMMRTHSATLGTDLRVIGSSQGGYSAMASLPLLSRMGTIRQVSAGEGPYNVFRTLDGPVRAAGGAARDAYAMNENLAFVPGHVRKVLESAKAYQSYAYDPAQVFTKDGTLLPAFTRQVIDGQDRALVTHLGVNTLPGSTRIYDMPEATVQLYAYHADELVPAQNTADMIDFLSKPPHRAASVQRGDCRDDSILVQSLLRIIKSDIKTHLICMPFQLDDFVATL
ncbi:MAG: hypothetical protein ABW220_18685, partial [Burkholderiaceae bacterium]